MKIIHVNYGWRHEYESDLQSSEHYLSSSENKAWKIQACVGFEPMTSVNTSAVLYQGYTSCTKAKI